jgi:hypothetical protein
MQYLPDEDAYLCSEGRKLVVSGIRHAKHPRLTDVTINEKYTR